MHDAIADFVHPIFNYGMNLLDRLEAGAALNLDKEQAALKKMLRTELAVTAWANPGSMNYRGKNSVLEKDESFFVAIRYSLTCWLDEMFVQHSPCSQVWAERTLEAALFGTSDGNWKFWKEAYQAQAQAETDALEVFYLCALLGFRGELRAAPDKLRNWLASAQDQLSTRPTKAWQVPGELEPPADVPPLRGLQKMKRMAIVCGMSLLLLIPIVVYNVARHY